MITAPPSARLLVIAAPGAGKTAVACARIAHLVDACDVPASRVLLISFTRTAVAEIRDRIRQGRISPEAAASVQIRTIDSVSYQLGTAFDSAETAHARGAMSYEANLARLADLLQSGDEGLASYLSHYDHVLVDEAQDVVGTRAGIVTALVDALSSECGVTVLGDPCQAIYGFTSDQDGHSARDTADGLIEVLHRREFELRRLTKLYRASRPDLLKLFGASRSDLESGADSGQARYGILRETIETQGKTAGYRADLRDLSAAGEADLVLFRRRYDVLSASSYLSDPTRKGGAVPHRLRLGGTTPPIAPWVAYLLGDQTARILSEDQLQELWHQKAFHPILRGLDPTLLIPRLFRVGREGKWFSMERLRRGLGLHRPPVELCETELGNRGPILSTIHASKGREANVVRLYLPYERRTRADEVESTESSETDLDDADESEFDWEEECRVLYVGATRAKQEVQVGTAQRAGGRSLPSGRVVRYGKATQIQIGCDGDVSAHAHAEWQDAVEGQGLLASLHAATTPAWAEYSPTSRAYEVSVSLGGKTRRLCLLTKQVSDDLWRIAETKGYSKPARFLRYLYVVGVGTTAVADEDARRRLAPPYNESGLVLTPILKGLCVGASTREGAVANPKKRRTKWKTSR